MKANTGEQVMQTASLDNCKRLFKLSGWDDPQVLGVIKASETTGEIATLPPGKNFYYGDRIPAYSAGYLLRKLPQKIKTATLVIEPAHSLEPEGWWNVRYADDRNLASEFAENVEDALCLLAIKLFEEGVL